MKRQILLSVLLVLMFSVSSQANKLANGGFEDPATPLGSWNGLTPIPNWKFEGYIPTGGWQAGLIGNDVGRVRDIQGARIWGNDTVLYQEFDVDAGAGYVFSVYCHNNADGDTVDGIFHLVASFYDAANAELSSQIVASFDTAVEPTQALGEWVQISGSVTAPIGAVTGRVGLDLDDRTIGGMDFDDVSVRKAGAYNPIPSDGANVGLDLIALSWSNPAAKDPNNNTVTCDVYFEEDDGDPNILSPAIVTGLEDNTLLLADYGIVLQDDTVYHWRVDCTDPNNGGPLFYEGETWTFQVADLPPVVTVGDDEYLWLNMDDGDGDPGKVTLTVSGTYTDDGKSPITRVEWIAPDGGTIVSQSEPIPGTIEAVVEIAAPTVPDSLTLTLEVEDSAGIGADSLEVTVYNDCLAAAVADGDITEAESLGDINRDCNVNLDDFAILAEKWLQCLSAKGGCTP